MTEQFTFQERFRDIGAVYLNEWFPVPGAVKMDITGQKAFAGSGFAGDKNGRFGPGKLFDLFEHLLHGRADGNDVFVIVYHILLPAQVVDLIFQAAVLKGLVNGHLYFFTGIRPGDKVKGPGLDGFDNQPRILQRADHNDRSRRRMILQRFQVAARVGPIIGQNQDNGAE